MGLVFKREIKAFSKRSTVCLSCRFMSSASVIFLFSIADKLDFLVYIFADLLFAAIVCCPFCYDSGYTALKKVPESLSIFCLHFGGYRPRRFLRNFSFFSFLEQS
jgi:hypothetical protein